MSNERRHRNDTSDAVVSQTYRDLARERTPRHLDHEILNEARRAARSGRRPAPSWLRPLAWAATIGLSLAVILEIAELSQIEPSASDSPLYDRDDSTARSPAARRPTEPGSEVQPESSEPEARMEPRKSADDAPAASPPELKPFRDEGGAAARPNEARHDGPAPVELDSVEAADMQMIREAEERARLQAGSDKETASFAQQAVPGVASEAATDRYCDETRTDDPNRWLECILELEKQGLYDAARIERDLLQRAFPQPEIVR